MPPVRRLPDKSVNVTIWVVEKGIVLFMQLVSVYKFVRLKTLPRMVSTPFCWKTEAAFLL